MKPRRIPRMDHLPLQTRTCLFTDIVGSTFLKGSLDPRTARAVFMRSIEIFKECLPLKDVEYDDSALQKEAAGRIVSDTGDGVFAVFVSALDAVETALKVQWRISRETWPTEQPVTIRIGLDVGDTTTRPDAVHGIDQPFGTVTDSAARVMSLGAGGQILMTQGVSYLISNGLRRHPFHREGDDSLGDLRLQLESHGNYRFKGDRVAEGARPLEVFEVRPIALGPCSRPEASEKCWPCDDSGQAVTGWRPLPGLEVPGTHPDKWVLEQRIGVGGFGAAWLAHNRSNTKQKRVFKFCYDLARARSFRREKKLFDLLNQALEKDPNLRANIASIERSSMEATSSEVGPDPLPPYWVQSQHYQHGNLLEWALVTYGTAEQQLTPEMTEEEQHANLCKALAQIPEKVRLALWVELARTTHAVHQHGIIHRDIKPTNIFIRVDQNGTPRPVLADFGIGMIDDFSRLEAAGFTQGGFLGTEFDNNSSRTGTRLYTPPEALRGEKPSSSWDIYALGVLLYQLVRGDASLPMDFSWDQHVDDPILRADIGKGVFDGLKRWPTAAEFAESVAEHDERRRVMKEENAREQLRTERQKAKRRRVLTAVMAVLTIAAVAGAWYGFHQAARATRERSNTEIALLESNRQLERSQVEEGRAWLERGRAALNKGDHLSALMLAGRAIGYQGYGLGDQEGQPGTDAFPPLLAKPMNDPTAEQERAAEAIDVTQFLDSVRPTHLPLWTAVMTSFVHVVAFSPDGTRLAGGSSDNTIKIWDSSSGKELANIHGHTNSVTSLAFSSDGTQLASGSRDQTVKLWDASTGGELAVLKGHTASVLSIAFSPSGSCIASGSSDQTAKIWDTTSGKELICLYGHSSVESVDFSPDGKRLATGFMDHIIKLWDTASGKEIATLKGHTGGVRSVAFSPDGSRIVSGSQDTTIKLWDSASGRELASLEGHTNDVNKVIFSSDGRRLASGASDNSIKFWEASSGKELATLKGHNSVVESVAFSPDSSSLASASFDKTIKLWDTAMGKEVTNLQGHTRMVTRVAFSPKEPLLVSGSSDKSIKLWDSSSGKELTSIHGHTDRVFGVIFNPTGTRFASCSDDTTIKLWDAATGKDLITFVGHLQPVVCITFSPDGTRLASGSVDNRIKLWDAVSGRELSSLKGHNPNDIVTSVAFSPDGTRLVIGSYSNCIEVWDVASGTELVRINGDDEGMLSVTFSPDGARLASRSRHDRIKLWDANTGILIAITSPQEIQNGENWLHASCSLLSNDEKYLASPYGSDIFIVPNSCQNLDLAAPSRFGLLSLRGREIQFPKLKQATPMVHIRQDTLAQLAHTKLTPERRAELRMELCTKSSQFRAGTALWQRLLRGEWPGFEGATVPKDQAPTSIPTDSPIRRLYLLALIDATKHPQIHGHPTICQTAAQIVPVLTKEMMATNTISLAMMSLMQTLAKDDRPDMKAPREALLQRLNELASKNWLEVLHNSTTK